MNLNSRFFRATATVMAFAMINLAAPQGVITLFAPDPNAPKPAPEAKKEPKRTRLLSAKVMKTSQGRVGGSPYLAGQNKWDVVYKGVNLMTGAYTASGTDLSYEGGYGIPVNVTRSYNSNNPDEGPLGWGWTLSVDVRSTAGGLLKSSGSPVRSIPTSFKERPTADNDPRIADANEPVEAVVATDAGGMEETIQRDVDGVLTTPPWDKNVIDSEYEYVTMPSGSVYRVLKKNVVKTLEGTIYEYSKHGHYPNGLSPRSGGATGEASNVLKIDKVIDRHGNQTLYTYATTGQVTFTKSNGTVVEDRLVDIKMPNGHHIGFEWTGNRITRAKDLTHNGTTTIQINGVNRDVEYGYANGFLTSVTTPGGKTTAYGYGNAVTGQSSAGGPVSTGLLTSITDPRGLTTGIHYVMGGVASLPIGYVSSTACAYRVDAPNGARSYIWYQHARPPVNDLGADEFIDRYDKKAAFVDFAADGSRVNSGSIQVLWPDTPNNEVIDVYLTDSLDNLAGDFVGDWVWCKRYRMNSQDLLTETRRTFPGPNRAWALTYPNFGSLASERRAVPVSWNLQVVETTTEYNFMGNPLEKSVAEAMRNAGTGAWSYSPTKTTEYAYWGADKYFQQKAVRSKKDASNYRYSFTDYYDSNAVQGFRGQVKEIHGPKYSTFTLGSNWKYDIQPAAGSFPTVKFIPGTLDSYDAKGRVRRSYKLNRIYQGVGYYVITQTTYGADNDGSWGQANSVTEAYGNSIARTTYTLHYTPEGKADQVQDANGRVFETNYGPDGEVNFVTRTDSGLNQTIVNYTYGTSGITNGQVTSATDGLSGVMQSFSYIVSGGGLGQIAEVVQSGGGLPSYTVSYAYNPSGERSEAIFNTPNGDSRWQYGDYVRIGDPHRGKRAFQTLRKLDVSTGAGTSEEFHYCYDSAGTLTNAMFGQTPQNGTGAPTNAPYYTQNYPALKRFQAVYENDPAGRTLGLYHRWDQWNGSAYAGTPVLANECQYDAVKGLKTQSQTLVSNSSGTGWVAEGTETYGYEGERDYLTSADYDGSGPGAPITWTYRPTGNRDNAGYVYDDLDRITTSPGSVAYTHDPAGNRLTKGSAISYTWDARNRLLSLMNSGATTATYVYRVDGMRVSKAVGTTTTMYRHDGQMPMQEVELDGSGMVVVTDNASGMRGIDAISRTSLNGVVVRYPLYDSHGNMVGTVGSTGPASLADRRSYDAWGGVRSGSMSGAPTGRYCAGLGHVQDDESSLIYMRARYYEPSTGRFISEDPERDGNNPYVYCANEPLMKTDPSGEMVGCAVFMSVVALIAWFWQPDDATTKIMKVLVEALSMGVAMADLWCSIGAAKDLGGTKKVLYSAVAAGIGAVCAFVFISQTILLMMIASMDGDDSIGDKALLAAAGELIPTVEFEAVEE